MTIPLPFSLGLCIIGYILFLDGLYSMTEI